MDFDNLLQQAATALRAAKLVAVSSGAGISKESGIPTFRDALDGLWARYNPEELATPDAFRRNPDLVWSWYMYRATRVAMAEPNPGHFALADLENLVPQVVILTQNVDYLHARAGSTDIVELHGRLGRFKCFENCQGVPTLVDLSAITYEEERAAPCPYCDSKLRPDVVWFGERLPENALSRAWDIARRCDVMLVVGTSGIVEPAASLPRQAHEAGALVVEVNPQPSFISRHVDILLQGRAGEVLPRLVAQVRAGNRK